MSAINWADYLSYSEGLLFWKVSLNPRASIGSEAGALREDGYKTFGFRGRKYLVHRAIWEMHNSQIPDGLVVDHIDGNPTNNNLSNLRCTTYAGNNINKRRLTGVGFSGKSQKWRAYIKEDGKHRHLGVFTNFCEAVKVRKNKEKELKEKIYGCPKAV